VKTFEYSAVGPNGTLVRGRAWSTSELELDRELESKGMTLCSASAAGALRPHPRFSLAHVELISFTTQLSTLTSAGVPIVESLSSIGRRLENARSRALVADMVAGLEAGDALSAVMQRHPRAFPAVYRAAVEAGEASGSLHPILERLARYLEWSRGMRAIVVQALIYPAILTSAVFGLIMILLYWVLPRILKVFPGGRAKLPAETRLVLAISDFLHDNALLLGLGLLALSIALSWLWKNPGGRRFFHARILALPQIGGVVRQIATSRFASTASTLHASGCDVFTVLDVAGRTCGNAALEACFARASAAVRRGSTISAGLEAEREVDPLLKQMVGVGEKTGELDRCLARLVAHYDDEVPRSVKRFLAFLEPALLLGAAGIVAFVLLAALMPIFELYERIGG
jgi:type II secretory pathway component PulF